MNGESVYGIDILPTSCAFCECGLTLPTRGSVCGNGEGSENTRRFFDWTRIDDFGVPEFDAEHRRYTYGATLNVTSDGFAEPLEPVFVDDGRRKQWVVPAFGESAYWVCETCKGKLIESIRIELPPVDFSI